MAEQNKRIVVEGVNFSHLVQFPRILRAVTAGLQPGRLVIALLMITALITFGRLWDGALARTAAAPDGLLHGRWQEDVHGPNHQRALRNAAQYYTDLRPPRDEELDARTVLNAMGEEYPTRREARPTPEAKALFDQEFIAAVNDIHHTRPRRVFEATESHVVASVNQIVRNTVALSLPGVLTGLNDLLIQMPRLLWQNHTIFVIVYGVVMIVVFAVGGGAISRMAATQVATQQRLTIREAIDFSLRRLGAFVMAQLLPLIVLLVLCGVVVVMGVLMAAPVLDVIGALVYGLALVLGFLIAFLIVGFILGHPMLVPAVACENCSGADAMQRAYAYTVTRPLHLLGYWAVAILGLALGYLLVSILAVLTLNGTAALYGTLTESPALGLAGGHDLYSLTRPSPELPLGQWHDRWAGGLIGFWETVVICLVAAYVLSYYFSASTIVYLLMRRAADGQDIEEIWQTGFVPGTMAPAPAQP